MEANVVAAAIAPDKEGDNRDKNHDEEDSAHAGGSLEELATRGSTRSKLSAADTAGTNPFTIAVDKRSLCSNSE